MAELTKWPRLVVEGDNVTPEQADVILVRTRYPWVMSNDKEWQRQVEEILGLPDSEQVWEWQRTAIEHGMKYDWADHFRDSEAAWSALGRIPLNYLFNDRIESSWYGGPHGWCDWDGTIGSSNYNIGKWPKVEEVTEEWRLIAEAFPFLRLDCQLVTNEGTGVLAAQWHVEGGIARQVELTRPIRPMQDAEFTAILFDTSYERGVTLERLKSAVERTKASLT